MRTDILPFADPVIASFRRIFQERNAVETVTAAKTLTKYDSGKTLILNLAAGLTVELPSALTGLNFKFIVGTVPASGDYVIHSETENIHGAIDSADTIVQATTEDTVTLDATALVGDNLAFESDGTNWYVSGRIAATATVTATNE